MFLCFFFLASSTLIPIFYPYTTLFRSKNHDRQRKKIPATRWVPTRMAACQKPPPLPPAPPHPAARRLGHLGRHLLRRRDRKSTRLNSSHVAISYAVFC